MSWQSTSWVINHSKHKGSALLTLLCIANCANNEGTHARPGMSRLAKDTRLSRRQVVRIVEKLEASGELVIRKTEGVENSYSFPLMDKMSRVAERSTSDTIMSPTRDIAMAPIPKDGQEDKERSPLPPKKSHKPAVEFEVGPPPPYTGTEFLRQLADFEAHRKKLKCPMNELSRVRIYNVLTKVDEATATRALDDSIANGWKGVFPERIRQNGANGNGNSPPVDENPSWMHAPKRL